MMTNNSKAVINPLMTCVGCRMSVLTRYWAIVSLPINRRGTPLHDYIPTSRIKGSFQSWNHDLRKSIRAGKLDRIVRAAPAPLEDTDASSVDTAVIMGKIR